MLLEDFFLLYWVELPELHTANLNRLHSQQLLANANFSFNTLYPLLNIISVHPLVTRVNYAVKRVVKLDFLH